MKLPPLTSVTWKLAGAIAGTVALATSIIAPLLIADNIRSGRRHLQEELRTVALITAEAGAQAVALGEQDHALRILDRLAHMPSVEEAALLDGRGELVAHYRSGSQDDRHDGLLDTDEGTEIEEHIFGEDHLKIALPLLHDGRRVGLLVIHASAWHLRERAWSHARTVLLAAAALVLFALLCAWLLHRRVARPLHDLAGLIDEVSRKGDYSRRIHWESDDEIGVLSAGVNEMLAAVQQRDRQRDQAEAAQFRYAERLAILHAIEQAILVGQPLGAIAREALGYLQQVLGCHHGSLVELPADGSELLVLDWLGSGDLTTGLITGVAGAHLQRGEFYALDDLQALRDPTPALREAADLDVRSLLCVPLFGEGGLMGAMILGWREPEMVQRERLVVAQEVAEPLAIAIRQQRLREEVERERAALEHRVRERTAQLHESNRELEAFAYSVSHDLRAPLRAMEGFAVALREDYAGVLNEQGMDFAGRIVESSIRMNRLIEDLLEYSRVSLGEIEMGPVDLDDVMREVLGRLGDHLARRRAQVDVSPALGMVTANQQVLVHVLANLMTNAVKFVPEGQDPRVRVYSEVREQSLRLWVADQGIGIDPEHHERVFGMFQRLHALGRYPGTGIGLALVKRGVERMRGITGLQSTPGQGSRFWVQLEQPNP